MARTMTEDEAPRRRPAGWAVALVVIGLLVAMATLLYDAYVDRADREATPAGVEPQALPAASE